tara:strand:- start:76 stop:312 length:237 start_codon:yes stop_codon:yes gene_type:complete
VGVTAAFGRRSGPFASSAERCQNARHVVQLGLLCIIPTMHLRGAAKRSGEEGETITVATVPASGKPRLIRWVRARRRT